MLYILDKQTGGTDNFGTHIKIAEWFQIDGHYFLVGCARIVAMQAIVKERRQVLDHQIIDPRNTTIQALTRVSSDVQVQGRLIGPYHGTVWVPCTSCVYTCTSFLPQIFLCLAFRQ